MSPVVSFEQMRVDLENNLFESQREIESLNANLTDTKKVGNSWTQLTLLLNIGNLNIRAAFKSIAASLEARDAVKIVACFLHHGNSKVCLHVHFRFI